MIPLTLPIASNAQRIFVTRLSRDVISAPDHSGWLADTPAGSLWSGNEGLVELPLPATALQGDVLLVDPKEGRAERLIRAGSRHNTLLVTEQCDQLCLMCSQPPKKTHVDRFTYFEQACLLADHGATLGISGGEPTLHKAKLFALLEHVLAQRPDLSFHVLTNAQHFTAADAARLRAPCYRKVTWGIPLYSSDPAQHDRIVGKPGAFELLMASFVHLLRAGARIELRSVLTASTVAGLGPLSRYIARNLAHIEQWSLMGVENIGFARTRWSELYYDLHRDFAPIGDAIDRATLHGVAARLFNVPLCHVPAVYRGYAIASISDWKQRYSDKCQPCSARAECAGFFEWHPAELLEEVSPL